MREKLIELIREGEKKIVIADLMTPEQQKEYIYSQLADHLIANGLAVQKWIPVTERLPEDEELVLIHCKNGAMFVGYCGKQYCDFERRWRIKTALNSTKLLNLGRVTHWMPLPEPPKGE